MAKHNNTMIKCWWCRKPATKFTKIGDSLLEECEHCHRIYRDSSRALLTEEEYITRKVEELLQ